MASAALVEVDSLTFRYRRAHEPAVRDVSLRIVPGDVVLVAGPSGCGKSTLLRTINCLVPHSYSGELSGEVRIEGPFTTWVRTRAMVAVEQAPWKVNRERRPA